MTIMDKERHLILEKMLNLLGSKWVLLIMYSLCTEPHGFNKLLRSITGISPRILSLRLKEMAAAGLISKTILPTNPPQVEYRLTDKGMSLKTIILSIAEWAENGTPSKTKILKKIKADA